MAPLVFWGQPGWSVPQHHCGGGLPHDCDQLQLGGVPLRGEGCPLLRRAQLRLSAAAARIPDDPRPRGLACAACLGIGVRPNPQSQMTSCLSIMNTSQFIQLFRSWLRAKYSHSPSDDQEGVCKLLGLYEEQQQQQRQRNGEQSWMNQAASVYPLPYNAYRRSGHSRRMTDRNPGGRRLRQWLIEQIESGLYPGLLWENEERSMFRIPWKHAGKQDYNQEIDASIFKAWAVFKGKFKEGDKAEPATWKTRLRCALNKSPDFEEVTDRSQLDISEPYKVYRIVPEEEQKCKMSAAMSGSTPSEVTDMECSPSEIEELIKESSTDEYLGIIKRSHSPPQETCRTQATQEWWSPAHLSPVPTIPDAPPAGHFNAAFSQMMIAFYYGGKMVGNTLTTHTEGCRIALFQPPVSNELLYGPDSLQNIRFPPVELIENERQRHVTRKLFGHLERGVLVRSNREGIFIKRLCQSRVFWNGQCSPYGSSPSKLERDAVVRIFDTARFLAALQLYQEGQCSAPDPTVTLCFGEEFPDTNSAKYKLIIVQITQMNCQQLLETVNARKSAYSSGGLEICDETQSDQMARIFQDLCSYNGAQRSCFRENLPITV
ncbi:interferon regulatory factor 8 isoform X3 [Lepisosteus oculatus]|uniref:interferon regulatory factor 8 isoform X3 n=1 Tax=Lepisosteus oculatus TaxID=7918 RepID=UPI0035F514A7